MNEWLLQLWSDIRFAARTFAKRPSFTAVAACTLALGIGGTTAAFSIVYAVLLRPLPYKNPDRLAAIWITSTREKGLAKVFANYADYVEFRRHTRTLESVTAATWATRTSRVLTGAGPARDVMTVPATASFFDTLGVSASVGRTFQSEDEGRGCSIVLAHQFWLSTFGGDPTVAGKSVTLDQQPCTILGVMPERFSFYPLQTQAWILLGPAFQADQDAMLVGIFARLKPGATLAQAETELRSFYRALHPSGETRDLQPVVYGLHGEFTFLAGRTLRATLLLVFGAMLGVQLIACLNVANLVLARISERRREFAVRAALGSGPSRIIRQVLTEGLLLSAFGAIPGLAIAGIAVQYFRSTSPIELSVGADVRVNLAVFAFGVALSTATTLFFALLPALRASRVDFSQHLKTAGRGSVHGQQRAAKVVIAVEMALSFVLLIGAGLLMTSALRMGSEALGFNPAGVVATRVSPPIFRYSTPAQRMRLYDQLLERLERVPGVVSVTLASKIPPEAGGNQALEVHGRTVASGREIHDVGADAVTPQFFNVLNIAVRRGRTFRAEDRENSVPVVIINEALAQEYFPNADALGQQIRLGSPMPWLTIVGVVGNLKHTQLMNEMSWVETPILYRPLAQEPRASIQVAVRAAGDMGAVGREIQKQIAALDPLIPLNEIVPLSSRLAKVLVYPRFRATVLALFALGALLLSAVGLHGVLSQLVSQRIPEFGVRRAVGAQTRDLLWLVARQGGAPVVVGLGAGMCLTRWLGRGLASLLYGIQPTDPYVIAVVSFLLLAVATMAITTPANRAARVDPMIALRDE